MPDLNSNVFRIKRTIQRDPLKQFLCFFCWGFGAFRTHVHHQHDLTPVIDQLQLIVKNRGIDWQIPDLGSTEDCVIIARIRNQSS